MSMRRTPVQFGNFDDRFCDEFAEWIGGRRVLETFAGNGLFASMLAARGVDITATSRRSGHDGHADGLHFDVVEVDASPAVEKFGPDSDILLMCWPPADEYALMATIHWGSSKPVVFIGEVTDLDRGLLGGCGSDLFFALTDEIHVFANYSPKNMLDRAAVRMLSPTWFSRWKTAMSAEAEPRPQF